MGTCASCGGAVAEGAPVCPACGILVPPDLARIPERAADPRPPAPNPSPPAPQSPPSPAPTARAIRERFATGAIVGERYRIVGRVGKGGMGDVYRAEDLKLDQIVALKFLTREAATAPGEIARLFAEVRIARKVTHPSVCRVYDVGELDGLPFISMEYVDGEDFASLLRRIGRLPADKALHVAHQLCGGLAAAHERGVLHRDIKPANIMLDGAGQVRIMDFGLAGLAEQIIKERVRAGTPAYMAPEQVFGKGVTAQADLYGMGLVLYEMFTGKPVFRPKSVEELEKMHQAAITPPGLLVPDLDPAIDRAILWCLEREPAKRPRSAHEVAAMLPGGNALAAALMAGVTPSPELVAASGSAGVLRIRSVAALLGVLLLALATLLLIVPYTTVVPRVPLHKSDTVLADKAQSIVQDLGYSAEPRNRAWGFDYYEELVWEMEQQDKTPERWERLRYARPSPVDFWYRQSPRPLVPGMDTLKVTMQDPAWDVAGMVSLRMDPAGRLREFAAVPEMMPATPMRPTREKRPTPEVNWSPVFDAAGMEISEFTQVEPLRAPPVFADARAAWIGVYPENRGEAIRVEAAALEGRIVAFRIIEERWAKASTYMALEPVGRTLAGMVIAVLVNVVIILGAVVLGWRNLVFKRGDRSGALRFAIGVWVLHLASNVLLADHATQLDAELRVLARCVERSLLMGGLFWLFYIAMEPYARRIWPETLISWSRLLSGRVRDPLVGQNVLVGTVAGVVSVVLYLLAQSSASWVGRPPSPLWVDPTHLPDALAGGRHMLGLILTTAVIGARFALGFLMALVILKLILRERWRAVIAYGVLHTVIWSLTSFASPLDWVFCAVITAICTYILVRYGLLALITATMTFGVLISVPLTADVMKFYAPSSFTAMGAVVAMAVLGGLAAAGTFSARPAA